MRRSLAASVLLTLVSTIAAAQTTEQRSAPRTAAQLAAQCSSQPSTTRSVEESVAIFECIGYVSGVLDTHAVMVSIYHSPNAFCPPSSGVTHETAILALLQWLRRHSENADMSARTAILLALRERFPC